MINFTHDLEMRASIAEREREARAIARVSEAAAASRGLRAGFAARLVRLALSVDRDAACFWLSREFDRPSPADRAANGISYGR